MKEKMRWDPDAPYDYRFERGLYYHHILDNELLCGSQPTTADDIRYLKEAENVDTIISVCPLVFRASGVCCLCVCSESEWVGKVAAAR